jgi:hypothetical protein
MSSAGVLGNTGWSASTLKPGDEIAITVLAARAGNAAGLCRDPCQIRVSRPAAK